MLKVVYTRGGYEAIGFFKNKEEFDDWYPRQLLVWPDTIIISINEENR